MFKCVMCMNSSYFASDSTSALMIHCLARKEGASSELSGSAEAALADSTHCLQIAVHQGPGLADVSRTLVVGLCTQRPVCRSQCLTNCWKEVHVADRLLRKMKRWIQESYLFCARSVRWSLGAWLSLALPHSLMPQTRPLWWDQSSSTTARVALCLWSNRVNLKTAAWLT